MTSREYPAGAKAPDIDFVLSEDPNLPNGGILARFPGLYIPILDWSFNGPEPTDTPFHTDVITRQYDGLVDFPLYPLNLVADLNAVLGILYVHTDPFRVSLAPDPSTSPSIHTQRGDTDYYFFETADLPLLNPLRTLGVPEPVIDVVEPFFRVIVELGYDRSIQPWEPTPARLIPMHDPAKVVADLVDAIDEGINNAAALIGSPAPLRIPSPATTDQEVGERVSHVPATVGSHPPAVSQDDTVDEGTNNSAGLIGSPPPLSTPAPATAEQGEAVEQGARSQLPKSPAVAHDDFDASTRKVGRALVGELNSVIGKRHKIIHSVGDSGRTETIAKPARKASVRDPVTKAGSDINKTGLSDNNREDKAE